LRCLFAYSSSLQARYYSEVRDKHVLRPLMYLAERDIGAFATQMGFPILPCTLCGSQPDAHRAKV
jgi:tRNA 2-thiocytidine biosynthesis protein TtcA